VSRQWIQQLKRQEKQTGSFEAKPLKGVVGAKRKLKPFQEQLSRTPGRNAKRTRCNDEEVCQCERFNDWSEIKDSRIHL
jgi:hypothetical protein